MSNLDYRSAGDINTRFGSADLPSSSLIHRKRSRPDVSITASLELKAFDLPLISAGTGLSTEFLILLPHRKYRIGRNRRCCEFVFEDNRVSKRHCQIYFDAFNKKIYVSDGVNFVNSSEGSRVRVSLNGVFVNGDRIGGGKAVELFAGTEISLVCGKEGFCSFGNRIGFVVQRITFVDELVNDSERVFEYTGEIGGPGFARDGFGCGELMAKSEILLSRCRQILCSDDPILYIRESLYPCDDMRVRSVGRNRVRNNLALNHSDAVKSPICRALELEFAAPISEAAYAGNEQLDQFITAKGSVTCGNLHQNDNNGAPLEDGPSVKEVLLEKKSTFCVLPPGKKFYLNCLHSTNDGSRDQDTVSLPELLHPVESLVRIFIATFTSDILWFLSYCEIPACLPVTIACHNTGKCWSSSLDDRTSVPYSDFPYVVAVYPPFPEVIAFGKDRKKLGIACHHPKLFVLQRKDSIRIIITSANLVPKQWHVVSNTVWWQDFPRASSPDYSFLFSQLPQGVKDSRTDFAAELARFVASLITDVPSQAHWISELAKYDFKDAVGYLVASIPGIYTPKAPYISKFEHILTCDQHMQSSCNVNLLGSVEASVVGLSHLFRTSKDSRGIHLKKLATFLGKCNENAFGMSEIILMRNTNIPADINAISVLIPNPEDISQGDCVQLGFLPRNIARWVAPLADAGFFSFSAYIYRKEALSNALEGSNYKSQLLLYVSQGPNFAGMSESMTNVHVSALCSLVASIQRCTGLWRLQEVLCQHKWPEHSETDFVFGSSSVGAVNAPFLAAFSAAAGKRSLRFSESEESDPDWGCWTVSQESRNPSMRILFPTIERVKTATTGIWASKYLLCFSEKTWLRLRSSGILNDAVPHPIDRVGHPMHVKVARRRFKSRNDKSSCGWVYCGSHNFSAAAWGRPISLSKPNHSVLGSRLHICNYELGIIFIVPPSSNENLDDIALPFVVPAPRYRNTDKPATKQAMREASSEFTQQQKLKFAVGTNLIIEEEEQVLLDEEEEEEEETLEASKEYIAVEKEDEKVYAETLWSQVDSSQSC